MNSFNRTIRPFLATGLSLALFVTCSKRSQGPFQPDHPLFDRFSAQTLLGDDDLPAEPSQIKFLPDLPQFLVVGKKGDIRHFVMQENGARLLGGFTLPEVAPAPGEIGLTGLAFDPDFAANQFFYVCYTTGDNRFNRISRLHWSSDYGQIAASATTVIEIDRYFPDEPQHGIYDVRFGNDGALYSAIGDATQPEFSQNPRSLLGKLIRILPKTTEAGGYTIPTDNPFVNEPGVLPEIAAFGLRTPFRLAAWRDFMFIAEVGENAYEEIERYALGRLNFGWPHCEGNCQVGGYQDPVFTISHSDPFYQTQDPEASTSSRLSISLGVTYPILNADPYQGLLDGHLIFNDVFQGYVRAAPIRGDGSLGPSHHIFHLEFITSMDLGPDGLIYGTTIFNPRVFVVRLKESP